MHIKGAKPLSMTTNHKIFFLVPEANQVGHVLHIIANKNMNDLTTLTNGSYAPSAWYANIVPESTKVKCSSNGSKNDQCRELSISSYTH